MLIETFPARHVANPQAHRRRAYGQAEQRVLSLAQHEAARRDMAAWPGYAPTPLRALPGLAARIGVGRLFYKDEAGRFGLGSFKALGGAYAVLGLLQQRIAARGLAIPDVAALAAGAGRAIAAGITVAAATDGNHGRSVAWGARLLGCRAVIFLHETVSAGRAAGIARYGAEIRRVPGGYDAAVHACAAASRDRGWVLLADTSDDPFDPVCARIMQGYTVLADEVLAALPDGMRPTHTFVQAGVGGLAAAVAGHFWERHGSARGRIVVVEPDRADCVFRSVAAGAPARVPGSADTFMACLAAGEVSAPAWQILRHGADDVLALPDASAPAAMRLLAAGTDGDPPIVSGESGCAAIAGLVAAAQDPRLRTALGLSPAACVVAIGSEGATDPTVYRETVGRDAQEVA